MNKAGANPEANKTPEEQEPEVKEGEKGPEEVPK
jgi:hypothetical protein